MNCGECEERMSDYMDGALAIAERECIVQHLGSCRACTELFAAMNDVVAWGKSFPTYEAPAWLPARILANTPVIAKETWLDTLASVGRWIIEPRTALGIFTATMVLGWFGSIAGVSPDWNAVVRDPASVYYSAVKAYHRSPLVNEIQARIEQFREISG